ncbi:4-(cytidine 5'-diphospho)-2-C-methyl-D-erythritol kinase [Fulvivirga lutea]|uniref:4-diphosphocytidyl-2-C-methyl-D-erythritol kinase n=1 Tax=Fulvivirga lutea TaxID=2810512 RepID=A0A974ZZZ7_9BACT|nr:4-(cytidine 5'-diphospho)-2-C-methyl-D-erythritol kinase [Fulvivirga lutea]QSE95937.1 4-(cytidine 5'-diphospho)-2-C-methyl-D-erythritol kinase [Fulvivirga lutea]
MVVFPNAKINLGLNILSKREDGYHNIESCFYPFDLSDILEILPAKKLSFTSSGIAIPGNTKNNLCIRAFELLKADFNITDVQIHLHKIIPIGAGLGGGSSDASFTLKVLNQLFDLQLTDDQLEAYAALLGSDCPFFIRNKPVLAKGTGTEFEDINISLAEYEIKIEYPQIHIGTAEAYAGVTPNKPSKSVKEILTQPISTWKNVLKNDFENSIFPNHPKIYSLKEDMYARGAVYASMTGSGSAVYGIFKRD